MIGRIRETVRGITPLAMVVGMVLGFVAFVALNVAVIANQKTFGQRCAKVTKAGSPEWHQCIDDLSKGKTNI